MAENAIDDLSLDAARSVAPYGLLIRWRRSGRTCPQSSGPEADEQIDLLVRHPSLGRGGARVQTLRILRPSWRSASCS